MFEMEDFTFTPIEPENREKCYITTLLQSIQEKLEYLSVMVGTINQQNQAQILHNTAGKLSAITDSLEQEQKLITTIVNHFQTNPLLCTYLTDCSLKITKALNWIYELDKQLGTLVQSPQPQVEIKHLEEEAENLIIQFTALQTKDKRESDGLKLEGLKDSIRQFHDKLEKLDPTASPNSEQIQAIRNYLQTNCSFFEGPGVAMEQHCDSTN